MKSQVARADPVNRKAHSRFVVFTNDRGAVYPLGRKSLDNYIFRLAVNYMNYKKYSNNKRTFQEGVSPWEGTQKRCKIS